MLSSFVMFSVQMTFVWLPCLICVNNCHAVYNTVFYKYQFWLYSLKLSETFREWESKNLSLLSCRKMCLCVCTRAINSLFFPPLQCRSQPHIGLRHVTKQRVCFPFVFLLCLPVLCPVWNRKYWFWSLSCSYPEEGNINDIFPQLLFDSQTYNTPNILYIYIRV